MKKKKNEPAEQPVMAAFMAMKNSSPFDRRYTGKRVRQSEKRRAGIMKRERRLKKLGWSLRFFDGGK